MRDPVLRRRYEEIAQAVGEQLDHGSDLEELLGSSIDARKLVSSLTLFRIAARSLVGEDKCYEDIAALCHSLLEQAGRPGYHPCRLTLDRIGPEKI